MDDTDSWSHSPFRIYNRPMILRHLFCTSLCLLPDPVFSTGPRVFPTAPASRFPSSLPDMLFLRDSIDAILTIWLPEPFDKNAAVFDVLEIFWMDMGQIAFNLLNLRYLQQDRMPFFPQASCFLLGQAQKSNFEFLDPNVTYFRLFVVLFYLFFFLRFPFFSSSLVIVLLHLLTFYFACFQFKNWYVSLHCADYSYLGIIGKMFLPEAEYGWYQFWSKMMTSDVEQNDVDNLGRVRLGYSGIRISSDPENSDLRPQTLQNQTPRNY